MKSYREHVSKQEKFSIRKLSVGVVSLAIAGLATVNTYGAEVKADEATAPATEVTTTDIATSDAAVATSSKLTSTTVTEGNKTVTTTYVESPELEKAKADAATEGVTVTEEAEKVQPSIAAAEADNKAQTAEINTVVENYKKAKAEYEAKSQEITLIEKRNADAEAAYKKQVEDYNTQQAAYDKALEEYNAKKAAYDAKVAEKAVADKANAEAKAKYDAEVAVYNTAKAQYDKDLQEYQAKKAQYDKDKEAYGKLVAKKAEEDAAKKKYDADLNTYNVKKAQYENDYIAYQKKLAEYEIAKKQYTDAKQAYDKYMTDNAYADLKNVSTVQDLTFQREGGATHTIDGISTYLTRDAQARLNTSNVHQYDSNKLEAADIVATSPWANNETEYIQVKEGDKFVVTYDNLNQSSMREDTDMHPIKRVIYRYEILSLPSNDGKGIAAVSSDPTVTLTVGASTDQNKPVKVAVDVEFYDGDGKKFDLTKRNAIVALNSLNHWTGASYVDSGDKPRALTVEAKDKDGNTVRGTWDPYADGSSMSIENNEVKVKTGRANFGDASVSISADNPLKIVKQTYGYVEVEAGKWAPGTTPEKEEVTDALTVNASGSGSVHSIGTEEFTFEGKDDVLGSYKVDATTGQITFTPKKKFETVDHQESVNVGNNKFIPIPNSSVSYDAATKEVTSFKDNQYIEHGSVFNGETSSTLEGWDNPSSKYLYYGGAGLKMSDGHLVFTANGANAAGQPTVYWFAINSNVGLPKEPGKEPKEPTAPEEPKAPTPPTITIEKLPAIPTEPTPPTAPTAPAKPTYTVITVDVEEPKAPTPPTQPTPPTPEVVPNTKPVKPEAEVKWHKNKVVTETDIPTPPTPVPPTPYNPPTPIVPPTPEVPTEPTPEVPEQPVQPAQPQTPALPNTGTESSTAAVLAGAMAGLLGLGLARKKKED
ncbi:YSIRK-type signal peptide-containing protein [Streptococcus parasanguinis]|uniref:GbpC/Spa domain-containing protein n=1 Tax=Streptococcus parasanguinis TaxID=1318 RepID=UPI0012BBF0C2|nr:GbpC/Spa domain-containing protein [Streptococcus parasanguinis]MTS09742.1 YSIRK-type signal peptide-containing protein [Streptococcus parasanguinis]